MDWLGGNKSEQTENLNGINTEKYVHLSVRSAYSKMFLFNFCFTLLLLLVNLLLTVKNLQLLKWSGRLTWVITAAVLFILFIELSCSVFTPECDSCAPQATKKKSLGGLGLWLKWFFLRGEDKELVLGAGGDFETVQPTAEEIQTNLSL